MTVDSVLVESMTAVGWLVDVSNPSWVLVSVAETLVALLGIRSSVGTAARDSAHFSPTCALSKERVAA